MLRQLLSSDNGQSMVMPRQLLSSSDNDQSMVIYP